MSSPLYALVLYSLSLLLHHRMCYLLVGQQLSPPVCIIAAAEEYRHDLMMESKHHSILSSHQKQPGPIQPQCQFAC